MARRTVAVAASLFLVCACAAKRELVVTSEPSGALVRLDDTVVGTTPYTTTFDAYGTRRVTLYLPGYRSLTHVFEMKPPWYGNFPFDVVSEVLLPFGWHDRHVVPLTLERESGAVTTPDFEAVLERAQALRYAEPTGPRPTPPKIPPTPPVPPAGDPGPRPRHEMHR